MLRKIEECKNYRNTSVYIICVELNLRCSIGYKNYYMLIFFVDSDKKLSIAVPCDANRFRECSNFIIETVIVDESDELVDDSMCRYSLVEFQKYLTDNVELFVRN